MKCCWLISTVKCHGHRRAHPQPPEELLEVSICARGSGSPSGDDFTSVIRAAGFRYRSISQGERQISSMADIV